VWPEDAHPHLPILFIIYYYIYGRQPKVILTNVLKTEVGRKYIKSQLIIDANSSDADKLQSDRPPSSSVASLEIWQILSHPHQSLVIPKRQPKVTLTNVLRTKIGRKYIKTHLISDANVCHADKLQSDRPTSSSVDSLEICQKLSPSHQSHVISKRYNFTFVSIEVVILIIIQHTSCNMENLYEELFVEVSLTAVHIWLRKVVEMLTHGMKLSFIVQFPAESCAHGFLTETPSCSTSSKQMDPALDIKITTLYMGKFKGIATGCVTVGQLIFIGLNVELLVDTIHLRRIGLWRNNDDSHSSKSNTVLFLWLSKNYVEQQLCLSPLTAKSSEFIFLELFQPPTEREQMKLNEVILEVSKNNNLPDLSDFLSWKQAFPLFDDLSSENSSFINCCHDSFQQQLKKNSAPESKINVIEPNYAVLQKQNNGHYSISMSPKPADEWKEIRETGPVQNLIVYPPPPTKGGLGVTREDLECLEHGEFLNDVIIDFYLKYLLLEKAPKHFAERSHIFSSFFYKCLTRMEKNSEENPNLSVAQRRHKRVKTWTRHINIFSKDYIFVPVNEESHWYIAVICFPGLEEAVYEMCPDQCSLQPQTQQSPFQSEKKTETVRTHTISSSSNSKIKKLCKRPCILILDSLKASSLQNTIHILREYLEVEWEVKRKTHREFSKSTMIDFCPRVPKQDNSSDCGVYLLQYVETFFQSPIINFELPIHLDRWFPRRVVRNKREEIRDLILQLHLQQLSGSSS
uniref:SUMO specific peptidase 7 n=1 Tax=Sphenodon punctatus TaxID=8508 RepID=A0A8D0HRJ1_SPHPU